MDAIARMMVMMHHYSSWAASAMLIIGLAAFLLGSRIQSTAGRIVVLGLATAVLAFSVVTGLMVAPLDDWQHQHGSCLLNSLHKGVGP